MALPIRRGTIIIILALFDGLHMACAVRSYRLTRPKHCLLVLQGPPRWDIGETWGGRHHLPSMLQAATTSSSRASNEQLWMRLKRDGAISGLMSASSPQEHLRLPSKVHEDLRLGQTVDGTHRDQHSHPFSSRPRSR